jgi:hypothetical protein
MLRVTMPRKGSKRPPRRPQPARPQPVRPQDDPNETLQRVIPKRQIQVQDGDVVVRRERLPRLNPYAIAPPPYRYLVMVYPGVTPIHTYSGFQHAATEAEQMAARGRARVIYIEDDVPTVLADHRPSS